MVVHGAPSSIQYRGWGEKWLLGEPDPDELEPLALCWHAHPRFDTSELPDRRVVIAFELNGRPERFWAVVESVGCSICDHDPGFDVDVVVHAELPALYRLFYHQQSVASAVKDGQIRLDGQAALVRRMPKVLDLLNPAVLGVDASAPRPIWLS